MVGIRSTLDEREWALEQLGLGRSGAWVARCLGRDVRAVLRWARLAGMKMITSRHGGIVPIEGSGQVVAVQARGHGSRLDEHHRVELQVMHDRGCSNREIAIVLGVHPTTIGRELARGRVEGRYLARTGQRRAVQARMRPKPSKLDRPLLRAQVVDALNLRFSPHQVGAELRRRFPDDETMRVSHETIYQALYVQGRGALRDELKVDKALRSGRTKRLPVSKLPATRNRPWLAGHEISNRPAEVEDRALPGHWEGDLVLGARHATALITLVERKSRFVLIRRLPQDHGSTTVTDQLIEMAAAVPAALRETLTWDRGAEMAEHARFTMATNTKVFFCDPYSPWQRGSNENTNGLIRDFFPKGTDFAQVTDQQIAEAQHLLNIRPRQTLNWATPTETLNQDLIALTA